MAIGECGLDKLSKHPILVQQTVLIKQIERAVALHKPIILHVVKAFEEIIKITKPYINKTSFIIHGFNKKPELMNQLLNHGFNFSFGHHILNENSNAYHCLEQAPLDRIFLETDDSNINIQEVYLKASQAKSCDLKELETQIAQNLEQIFNAKF